MFTTSGSKSIFSDASSFCRPEQSTFRILKVALIVWRSSGIFRGLPSRMDCGVPEISSVSTIKLPGLTGQIKEFFRRVFIKMLLSAGVLICCLSRGYGVLQNLSNDPDACSYCSVLLFCWFDFAES